jgi:hypothetical protein
MKSWRRTNPRSVRGAVRRGWHLVDLTGVSLAEKFNVSYLGLQIWSDRNMAGRYVSSFNPTKFAFEDPSDALIFKLKYS